MKTHLSSRTIEALEIVSAATARGKTDAYHQYLTSRGRILNNKYFAMKLGCLNRNTLESPEANEGEKDLARTLIAEEDPDLFL